MKMSKNGIIEVFDKMLAEANIDDPNQKTYELKINKEKDAGLKLWMNTKGTSMTKDFTAWRGRIWFNKAFKIDRVVAAYTNEAHRNIWDKKNTEELYADSTSHKNVNLIYQRFKKIAMFDAKEYYDK
jgi:hypothetical protein